MTREEAIWWVNHLFEIRKEEYFNKGMMEDAKEVEEAQRMAIEALKQKPVKHGKWIESKERSKHWYCSVCGCIHTDPETGKWRETFDYRYPFCPNCGADMRGDKE